MGVLLAIMWTLTDGRRIHTQQPLQDTLQEVSPNNAGGLAHSAINKDIPIPNVTHAVIHSVLNACPERFIRIRKVCIEKFQ